MHRWTGRIFSKGYHHTLDEADIYDVLPQDSTVKLSNSLGREWEKELYRWKTGGQPSLFTALWRCYRPQILAFTFLVLMEECLRVVQAVLMGYFIRLAEGLAQGSEVRGVVPDVYLHGAFLCLAFLLAAFLDHNFFHHGYRMRVAATSLIYRKVMRLPCSVLTPSVMEDIMNLVTKEMDVFPMVVLPATYILVAPIQLVVVSYLLWDWLQLGPLCIAGIFVLILLFPLQILMGKLSRILRQKMDAFTSQRLRKLQIIMGAIQEVRMSCWDKFCEKIVTSARDEELRHMRRLWRLQSFNSALTLTAGKLVMFVTFLLVLVAGQSVSAAQIFTAMALFETLRISVSILLPSGLLYLSDTVKSVRKVQEILTMEEKGTANMCRVGFQELQPNIAVKFTNYFATRDKGLDAPLVLVNIDVDMEKGKLYSVIGPPDSGKTSLLLGVMGELERQKGQLFHHGRLGYVPCQPWLFPGTIRENIVFGSEFVRHRYTQVLQACALSQEMDAFPQGDLTAVGERGLDLEISVQSRITLARAVYQNADIYLIDDVLKGLDAKSSMQIFKKCYCGLLKSKTRILVTNNVHHAKAAHKIVFMSQCTASYFGSFEELETWGVNVATYLTSRTHFSSDVTRSLDMVPPPPPCSTGSGQTPTLPAIQDLVPGVHSTPQSPDSIKDSLSGSFEMLPADYKESGELVVGDGDTSFRSGSPGGSTYKWYSLLGGGYCGIAVFIFLCLIEQGGFVLCEWWLAYWAEQYQANTTLTANGTVLGLEGEGVRGLGGRVVALDSRVYVYLGLVVFTVTVGFLQSAFFYMASSRAAQVLHNIALSSLLQAPLHFFNANNIGAVLSRFLRDVGIVDALPPILLDCIQLFSVLVATVVVIGVANYWLFFPLLPLSAAFLLARHYFHQSTQDVERIELSSKSAVGAHIVSSMEGLQTLRAFGVEQRFLHNFDVHQDRSTAACYLHLAANRWFGMRVDLIGFGAVVGVTVGAILVIQFQGLAIPGSLVGLSMFYALNLLNIQQPAMRRSAAVHFKMSSAERLLQCYQVVGELDCLTEGELRPPVAWPQYGIVTLEGVSVPPMSKTGPNTLKAVWACFRAEEKMGMLFRTAGEQQTFISVLFRLTEYTGTVRIDGLDIQNLSLQRLRDKIAMVPQNPTLFVGTIRQNLDPISRYTDAQVWRVLEEVHLYSFVESLPQRLYTDISSVAEVLSTGHRQLLRLARAILRQTKILIYEEPASALDIRCHAIIQRLLRTKFERCTVLHFAHLPDTIIDYDRIMVVSEGRVQEVETPHTLLQTAGNHLARMVAELGREEAERLASVARDKAESKPYVAPPINPQDLANPLPLRGEARGPAHLNVLPTFHSSRLVGVLNQLPTNKFSTNRL